MAILIHLALKVGLLFHIPLYLTLATFTLNVLLLCVIYVGSWEVLASN